MDAPKTVTVNWITQFYLTTSVSPAQTGVVSCSPPVPWYDANTVVTVTAIPNAGYAFWRWSGDLTSSNSPETLLMNNPKSASANFAPVPVAQFSATPTAGIAPLIVQFTDVSANATSWAWDFDNNGTVDSTLRNPIYTYNSPGTYTVSLTVTGVVGSDTKTRVDYINVLYPPPVADFSGSPRSGFEPPLTVQFTDTSTGVITSWAWDFDNNGTTDSTDQNPSYTYNEMGVYTVKLTVTGPGGSDTETKVNYIILPPPPVADFSGSPRSALEPPPLTVQFTDASTGNITSWEWDFDNNGTIDSAERNPSYTYNEMGVYTVKLTVTGPGGSDEERKTAYITVAPPPPWAKTYGGAGWDYAQSIQQTSDGGYIVAGQVSSFGAGSRDFWVLKLNSDGAIAWQKTYGGAGYDRADSIQQTADDGYIVAGRTLSFGAGGYDFWILKLNSNGIVLWQKTYGGADADYAYSVQETSDGGYVVAGNTCSFGLGYPYWDFWVLKLNSEGTVAWQKRYGGASSDEAYSIKQTTDGGYIVAGYTGSFGARLADIWVLKLNSDGTVAWQKTYGGANQDIGYSIQQTNDSGYVVAGYTGSFGTPLANFWVLKLNSDGTVSWQKKYGGANEDIAYSVHQTSDGGYVVAGESDSFAEVSFPDFWVLKLNSSGAAAWQKSYGGRIYSSEGANSARETSDGRFIVAGWTYSFGAGNSDLWVIRLDSDGAILFNQASHAHVRDTNAVPVDTNCTVTDTTVSGVDTSCTVTDTNCTITDTNATVMQQAP